MKRLQLNYCSQKKKVNGQLKKKKEIEVSLHSETVKLTDLEEKLSSLNQILLSSATAAAVATKITVNASGEQFLQNKINNKEKRVDNIFYYTVVCNNVVKIINFIIN